MLLHNEKTNLPPPKFLQIKQEDKTFASLLSKDDQNSSSIINHQRTPAESSFRVMYHGGAAGSIPFLWESQPGTPKHSLFPNSSYSLPPLTPPPSYQSCPKIVVTKSQQKGDKNNIITTFTTSPKSKRLNTIFSKFQSSPKKPKNALLNTLFSKLSISSRQSNVTPIASSNYSLSSSCSNSSSSYSFTSKKNSFPRSRSPIYFGLEIDDDDNNHKDHDDHDHDHKHEHDEHEEEEARSSYGTLTLLCFGKKEKNGGGWRGSRGRRHHLKVRSLRKGLLSIFASRATTV